MNKMKKHKMCLNMIVKNEAHVIEETLECMTPYIDYYVINDTGSTDTTIEVIKNFFKKKGIEGEIISHSFKTCECHPEKRFKEKKYFHFGWNRSYALNLCRGKSDYIWVIDADDVIVGNLQLPKKLTADAYNLNYGTGFVYMRTQIFKNDIKLGWKYEGTLHEFPSSKINSTKEDIIGDYYIDSRRLGDRSKDPKKYLNDALNFEEELMREPSNERYWFYMAQSYYDSGDYYNSMRAYKKRITMKKWYEEVYYSYWKVIECLICLKANWPEIEEACMNTYNYCADNKHQLRAEPLHKIAEHYMIEKNYQKAYDFLKRANEIKYPDKASLFVFKSVYDYEVKDKLAVCAFELGKYLEAYETSWLLYNSSVLPDDIKERIKKTMTSSLQKLKEQLKKTCVIYVGNKVVENDNRFCDIVNNLYDSYNFIIVGNKLSKIDRGLIFMDTKQFDKFIGHIKNLHMILLYDNINYLFDNLNRNTNIILIQLDADFKLVFENNLVMHVRQKEFLNKMCDKLNRIVCYDEDVKNNLCKFCNLDQTYVNILDDEHTNVLYDIGTKINNDVQVKDMIFNPFNNGIEYRFPEYLDYYKAGKDSDLIASIKLDMMMEVIKLYPTMPEPLVYIGNYYSDKENYIIASTFYNKAMTLADNVYLDLIKVSQAKCLTKQNKYQESFDLVDSVLKHDIIHDKHRPYVEDVRDTNIEYICDNTIKYNQEIVNKLINVKKDNPKIMLSVTTCKRFDLFQKTINSFLTCCTDLNLIDYWLCVDDNSSNNDRRIMKEKYGFFNFILKSESEKGHSKSMNMIYDKMNELNIDYLIHMEDDFQFIESRNYITECINILKFDPKLGQVLFNRNYGEVSDHQLGRITPGGIIKHTDQNQRYIEHEHHAWGTKAYNEYAKRYEGFGTHGYWPNYSFRPSVINCNVLRDVGPYYNTNHFEMEYAKEYTLRGYKSAFLDTFACIHIGKKTWEQTSTNAYALNQTVQFGVNNIQRDVHVIIDKNNPDYFKNFKTKTRDIIPYFIREQFDLVKTIDNKEIFYGNSFNYRRDVLSELNTHFNIWKNCNQNFTIIINDNATIHPDLKNLYSYLIELLDKSKYDVVIFSSGNTLELTKLTEPEDFVGYVVSNIGCQKLVNLAKTNKFIEKTIPEFINSVSDKLDIYKLNVGLFIGESRKYPDLPQLEGYEFYQHMDSPGEDLGSMEDLTVEQLKEMADNDPECVGFNSLGWLKKVIKPESDWIYLPGAENITEGLYVKKNNL